MSRAVNRREQFESQLRDLQKDISTLSHKLNVTTSAYIHPASSHTMMSSSSTSTIGSSNGHHFKGTNDALARHSIKTIERFDVSASCLENNQVQKVSEAIQHVCIAPQLHHITSHPVIDQSFEDESIVEKLRQEILLYKQDIHLYKKERDDALYRHEQVGNNSSPGHRWIYRHTYIIIIHNHHQHNHHHNHQYHHHSYHKYTNGKS